MGSELKTRNQATVARFRVRRAKRRWRALRRGVVVVVHMNWQRRRRWWGCASAKHEVGMALGQNPTTEPPWLGFGLHFAAIDGVGCCGVTAPPPMLNYREGMGGEVVWWVVVVCAYLLPGAPPASPYLLYPLSSPLYPLLTLLTAHWWAV